MIRLVLALFLCSGAAQAASLAGVTLPDTLAVDGQSLALNGLGLRTLTIFHVRAHVAGLYLSQRSGDERQIVTSPAPKAIVLQFLHSASKSDVERQFRAGEQADCGNGGCDTADQADFDRIHGRDALRRTEWRHPSELRRSECRIVVRAQRVPPDARLAGEGPSCPEAPPLSPTQPPSSISQRLTSSTKEDPP